MFRKCNKQYCFLFVDIIRKFLFRNFCIGCQRFNNGFGETSHIFLDDVWITAFQLAYNVEALSQLREDIDH